MTSVTAPGDPLGPLGDLIDNERRAAFFSGQLRPDPGAVRALLGALPHRPPPLSVHIAGSEGKTSTAERLAAGLTALGKRTASFTSPHLITPLERFRLDGALPPAQAVERAAREVRAAIDTLDVRPTWFDALVGVARCLHAELDVDAAVWETGLGGRLDSTRAVPADLCLITSISLEHTALLGDTVAAIAREKAGILRPGVPVAIPTSLPDAATAVIARRAESLGAPLRRVASRPGATPQERSADLASAALVCLAEAGRWSRDLSPGLSAVANHAPAGRGQLIGDVLYDGAHSLASVVELATRLAHAPAGPVVFASTNGRDARAMAAALIPVAAPLILTEIAGPRRVDAVDLARELGAGDVVPDPSAALARARDLRPAEARITVTGSLYLVGQLMPPGSLPC